MITKSSKDTLSSKLSGSNSARVSISQRDGKTFSLVNSLSSSFKETDPAFSPPITLGVNPPLVSWLTPKDEASNPCLT